MGLIQGNSLERGEGICWNSKKKKAEIADPRVNRHQRVHLLDWRAKCDIQLDHHACVEYLTKYPAKEEKCHQLQVMLLKIL